MDRTQCYYKNVSCVVCGRKGKIKIRKSDGKIMSHNFYYFGKIDLNFMKDSKYVYKILFDKNGEILRDKNGKIKMKKIKNELYDEKAKPRYVDYYECSRCYNNSK